MKIFAEIMKTLTIQQQRMRMKEHLGLKDQVKLSLVHRFWFQPLATRL